MPVSSTPQPGFCRDCAAPAQGGSQRCPQCHSPRLIFHHELHTLTIGHVDCDAFYASVEKRDNPDLAAVPVIIGGGTRGVVATACYIARMAGVRSAMPMFKALKLCPSAVVIRPNMEKYVAVGRAVRALMEELTPLVQPISIDEAFLDLAGTGRLHGRSPAQSLAWLAREVEQRLGITLSTGLAPNKFLAKIASDLDKPRGYSIIGQGEAKTFLASRPVSLIWGVGKSMEAALARDGITHISQLQTMDHGDLVRRYGAMGSRLYFLSRGEDQRTVARDDETRSISAETTFNADISEFRALEKILWQLSEKVSRRAKVSGLAGRSVTLKLKGTDFHSITRAATLAEASLLAERIFTAARRLLLHEATGKKFRLLGVGISHLEPSSPQQALKTLDATARTQARAEIAVDAVRQKFGPRILGRGIGLDD